MLGTIRGVVTEGAVLFPSAPILSVSTQDQGFRMLVVHPELRGSTWKLLSYLSIIAQIQDQPGANHSQICAKLFSAEVVIVMREKAEFVQHKEKFLGENILKVASTTGLWQYSRQTEYAATCKELMKHEVSFHALLVVDNCVGGHHLEV